MKKIRVLILAIFVLPFALYGAENQKLPYDYIDNDTKMSKELAEYNSKVKSKPKYKGDIEPSGFILGAGITAGFTIGRDKYEVISDGSSYGGYPLGIGLDILAGYKWFFTRGFGMRLYVDYNGIFYKDNRFDSHNIALNYDLLFNWVKTNPLKFGMILGLHTGAGITAYDKKYCVNTCKTEVDSVIGGNIGFRFVIHNHSAIEIFGQPRLYLNASSANNTTVNDLNNDSNTSAFKEFAITANLRFVYTF